MISLTLSHLETIPATGTHMIWGVNFALNNVSVAVAEAKAIRKAFTAGGAAFDAGIILDAIEIGNEADLYAHHGLRPTPWNASVYTPQCVILLYLHCYQYSFLLPDRLGSFQMGAIRQRHHHWSKPATQRSPAPPPCIVRVRTSRQFFRVFSAAALFRGSSPRTFGEIYRYVSCLIS